MNIVLQTTLSRRRTSRSWLSHSLILLLGLGIFWAEPGSAHHVIGRPAYNLNEDSNTPPSMQIETQVGDYFITYMVFPAFPRPNEPGRINLYAKRIDNNKPFQGQVHFSVHDDSWFNQRKESIGTQTGGDYYVFRQRFLFRQPGAYIITASFEDQGVPYVIDFPLQIGSPSRLGIIGGLVGFIALLLLSVNIYRRKQLVTEKVRIAARDRKNTLP